MTRCIAGDEAERRSTTSGAAPLLNSGGSSSVLAVAPRLNLAQVLIDHVVFFGTSQGVTELLACLCALAYGLARVCTSHPVDPVCHGDAGIVGWMLTTHRRPPTLWRVPDEAKTFP